MNDITKRVYSIVSQQLKIEAHKLRPEASFIGELGADSLAIVELIMAMEEEFGFEIPDDEAEKIQTVGEVIDYINANKEHFE